MTSDPRVNSCELADAVMAIDAPDVLIVSASYEERCLSLANEYSQNRAENLPIAICVNEDSVEKTLKRRDQLNSLFEKSNIFGLLKTDPIGTADGLIDLANWINASHFRRALVDISCFTHEALCMLVKVLHEHVEGVDISLAYVPAKHYDQEKTIEDGGEYADDKAPVWLSKGLKEIRSVLGYAGDLSPSKDIHLIVLVGFDSERTIRLIEEYEPEAVTLGVGSKDPIEDRFLPENERFIAEIQAIQPGFDSFRFSPSCPFQVATELKKVVERHPDKNIVLAPMNTKLSTLGAIRALSDMPHIQACYTVPLLYNYENYSVPSDTLMYLYLNDLFS